MARAPEASARRRRRSPEAAEREILDAAERLFKTRPPHEVTVRAVMAETTLSRNSFYVYFRDRYDLIGRLVLRLRADADAALDLFAKREGDSASAGRDALVAIARLYGENAPILRELQDAARSNPSAAQAWDEFTRRAYDRVMAPLMEEIRSGREGDSDPETLVRALLTMTRACFLEHAGRDEADLDRLVDALARIWQRALFP
jgi:AcrR family transcriptional regulator